MDGNTRDVILSAIGAIVAVASAYIAARWHITPKNNGKSGPEPPTDSKK